MKLVFLHGRSQEDKDPLVLRQKWVAALRAGLDKAGLELPIDEWDIFFPYYGDALRDVTSDMPESLATVRLPLQEHQAHFSCAVLQDCLDEIGVTEEVIAAKTPPNDPLGERLSIAASNEFFQKGLQLLDRYVPRAGTRLIEATAADVSMYLHDPDVQGYIDNGIARAFRDCEGEETVVVGHSMGSIIAYSVLSKARVVTCPVKAFISVGSPLGMQAIREALEPIEHPPKVDYWFNAYDERDVVALNPLDANNFPTSPAIENYSGVENESDNHHKIHGYLSNQVVATAIADALRS